jgi:hypothetical protein
MENRMNTIAKLKHSRNAWKGKAIARGNTQRYQRKQIRRIRRKRDHYKKEAREAKAQLENERRKNSSVPVSTKEDLVYLALQLFLVARIGFRAVARVLQVLGNHLGLTKAPCAQTIINWVVRLSITRIEYAAQRVVPPMDSPASSNGRILLIDTSIGLGLGKILSVLALDANYHVSNQTAPTLRELDCIGVCVAPSWTGETIAEFLQKLIACIGRPLAYLKDGGTDLSKAIRLLGERGLPSFCIDDVSHTIANLLKHEYQNHPMFETFISACGKASKKLKQTLLACLAPPKVSTKARFMNLHRLVKWAHQVLQHSPKGRAAKGSVLAKLRASLDRIPECKAFINHFLRDAKPLLECQKVLKNKGLSHDTYRQCLQRVETIPPQSPVRIGFTAWMDKQLSVAKKLGLDQVGMPVSSDNVESLFGVSKQHGTGEIKDANRIALRIPAMCGEVTRQDAQRVLAIRVKEQQELEGSLPSLIGQRRQVLPNPGCLEKIQPDETQRDLELIPRAEKRSKDSLTDCISDGCGKIMVPLTGLEEQTRSPPEPEISRR